jgi:hypothetical protein
MLNAFNFRYMRFVNNWDPITRLVPPYRHAGARIHLTSDGYTIRKPMLAYSAPADATADKSPHFEVHEDDKGLAPMTNDEFQEFQDRVKAERTPPPDSPNGPMMRGSISVLAPHRIATYVSRLRTIGQQNWK